MKKNIKIFGGFVLLVIITTLLLSIFYSSAFIPSCMLMGSLELFIICYYVKDKDKELMKVLFVFGIILIVASLGYTFMRLL